MGLIEVFGGLFLSKFAYNLQRPKSATESASYKTYERQYHNKLANMDLWDGIEYQIDKHLKFYNKEKCDWYKAGVYWKGDKNKYIQINRITMRINREYSNSGLTMEKFVKQYFRKLKRQHKFDDSFWNVSFYESYYNIVLYDDDGNPHYFNCNTID